MPLEALRTTSGYKESILNQSVVYNGTTVSTTTKFKAHYIEVSDTLTYYKADSAVQA